MANKNSKNKQPDRKCDTSRTSSQGRKTASGGEINKRGNKEIDEDTKTPVKDINKSRNQNR